MKTSSILIATLFLIGFVASQDAVNNCCWKVGSPGVAYAYVNNDPANSPCYPLCWYGGVLDFNGAKCDDYCKDKAKKITKPKPGKRLLTEFSA
jgi:hypothetical protein